MLISHQEILSSMGPQMLSISSVEETAGERSSGNYSLCMYVYVYAAATPAPLMPGKLLKVCKQKTLTHLTTSCALQSRGEKVAIDHKSKAGQSAQFSKSLECYMELSDCTQ